MVRRLGLLVLLLIAALGAGAAWLDSQLSRPYTGRESEHTFVEIPHGTSRWHIAGILRHDDVIRNRVAFALFSEWHFRKPMQAGEYLFDQPLDSRQVFWKIAHGQIYVHTIVVPEGWSTYEIAADLDSQGVCSRQAFLAAAQDTSLIADLAPHARSLEGFLFPSTYKFTRHTTCDQVVAEMTGEFRRVWKSIAPAGTRDFPEGLTLEQLVTLASLVERETPNPAERPLVAGVFYNRLRRGYPLQCDPTVQYAMEMAGRPERSVHAQDLRVDSAYNTYEHRGLPPGPIANPGEASLRAALHPATTDYMYFVANNHGGHFFSRTLAEHNRNVARYRRLLAGEPPLPDPPPKKRVEPVHRTRKPQPRSTHRGQYRGHS
ncbi:MAG TPA: endolytic transglycosylase MltG [Candidatus Acidoferrales bacterium]|nr:endolytic transglycosylase MltG [Candidatus Acidoferrales bacterium]